ncbi:cytochrome C biogenesis protein CcmH [Pleomorphomonas diazotrophica]|uniref:Cytochrome c-type biogenesis protein n=1 Tax=Pleomorphomonas diazotrophica TaxID=1166257 RepID=A0A1I4SH63_9HYPH|nr:cytochrome c-type biogenesis protein [Pleomorphomonas diazotrophica]PKR88949.1 cytochrome C biogenesis protein CcmH [Pleomorphomonas diazotrophica]SFM63671.1 cytochrome c-type biogenesis protein CcmH [Pleomorphomonas diazotrophica]
MRRLLSALAVLLALAAPAAAVDPSERLPDPAQEERARAISEELRCLVCQNQSIDASDAQLAKDLRIIVRERIAAGDSDNEVRDFLVARYGEFVLLRPRAHGIGLLLWALPPALLLIAGTGLFIAFRRRPPAAATADSLSADEEAALKALSREEDESPNL